MMAQPTTSPAPAAELSAPPAPAAVAPTDPTIAQARWRLLRNGVAGATVAAAAALAAVVFLAGRADWWRGYVAATVATAMAAAASLVPLWAGVRGTPAQLIQMFMIATGTRAAVAIGLSALAVGVGHYPALPTFGLLIPYYLALLAAEAGSLARGLKLRA